MKIIYFITFIGIFAFSLKSQETKKDSATNFYELKQPQSNKWDSVYKNGTCQNIIKF